MKSMNRSLTSPTEPLLINWPQGGKKSLRLQYDPPREVSGESQVMHPGWQTRVRLCFWAVGMNGQSPPPCLPEKQGIHKSPATDTALCTLVKAHTHTLTHMHTDTHFPITSMSTSYPFPLTLPHTHKIQRNYPGGLSPPCLLSLLFLLRGHLFSAVLLHITPFRLSHLSYAFMVFLSFYSPLFLFTRFFYKVRHCIFWLGLAL